MRTLQKLKNKKDGFTLIELMIVVVIIGILAMIAIPSMMNYIKRTKTSEAGLNLKAMYEGAVAYYTGDRQAARGLSGAVSSQCVANNQESSNDPGREKTTIPAGEYASGQPFYFINTAFPDPVFFQYAINDAAPGCAPAVVHAAGPLYSFDAFGDLDGDDTESLFEIVAGIDGDNNMYRQPGIFVQNELE